MNLNREGEGSKWKGTFGETKFLKYPSVASKRHDHFDSLTDSD